MDINQDKPGIISWRLWRKAMKLWADEDTLCQPLGKWYKSGNDLDQTWPSYYNFTNDCSYPTCAVDTYRQNSTGEGYYCRWDNYMTSIHATMTVSYYHQWLSQ
eukprot:15365547-Ditylum_brightwellii.AAC.1